MGEVKPGQRLGSGRAMAAQSGVCLAVVREAMAQLRAEGLVDVRQGAGIFVARRLPVARAVRASRRRATRREVHQLRRALEPVAAEVAARRASQGQLLELRLALDERWHARTAGDLEAFTAADRALHLAMCRAAGNAAGVSEHRMAAAILHPDFAVRARHLADDDRLHELHEVLVDAIERKRWRQARRAAAAVAVLESHPP
jgi:DNA-binding FadR family transcriptional regulator